ncbi:MAG TPA: hypothetical protein DEB17_08545 [Chlorobaculum sp.]|uniref:Uncharacterized protein n=1 Tax=Chlorobaculum tepidum (strain ATCC 49652 / DSM 12025 / NBRC 103806 / TLS) TaxID=194439 RepID=Q8KEZ3_CHLTE|nr:hypothetical protein CT0539 [Chlorobaculum tepidum TLS]HBU24019.1 hypothetical protein [Chlorobaculum sp.]
MTTEAMMKSDSLPVEITRNGDCHFAANRYVRSTCNIHHQPEFHPLTR